MESAAYVYLFSNVCIARYLLPRFHVFITSTTKFIKGKRGVKEREVFFPLSSSLSESKSAGISRINQKHLSN